MKKLEISQADESDFFEELSQNPKKGTVIRQSGGLRKIRMAIAGRGKSSSLRIIYYYFELKGNVYLIAAYAKSKQENLTDAQLKTLRKFKDSLEALERE